MKLVPRVPPVPPVPPVPLLLYGRTYCHLCEDMARALRARGVAFVDIDVDSDPALEERWGMLVPVLADALGREICHYHLDEAALERALGVK